MKIPKYWAKGHAPFQRSDGKRSEIECWKWSNVSQQDAEAKGKARAEELAKKLVAGEPLNRYGYADRPLREEAVQSIRGGDLAVVTRNLYGALVLNAAKAMFIDVDFPPPSRGGGLLGRLFGKKPADPEPAAVAQVQAWAAQHADLAMRIYRTCAGLRCLITNKIFDPTDSQTIDLLSSIGSDPLYVRLCQAQACFRARLTPKPWRCGLKMPPTRFPWLKPDQETQFRRWQSSYEQVIPRFGVCRFVKQMGPVQVHPEIRPILTLHDHFVCAPAERPLA